MWCYLQISRFGVAACSIALVKGVGAIISCNDVFTDKVMTMETVQTILQDARGGPMQVYASVIDPTKDPFLLHTKFNPQNRLSYGYTEVRNRYNGAMKDRFAP